MIKMYVQSKIQKKSRMYFPDDVWGEIKSFLVGDRNDIDGVMSLFAERRRLVGIMDGLLHECGYMSMMSSVVLYHLDYQIVEAKKMIYNRIGKTKPKENEA
jgi:hypothetical protein